ncbi:GMP synthase glutamine-hydrolyzing [Melioribacter roseus P3M-2]|uniref:GMP synthase [glutamine-hydrolyzing] n=1 Tax=Melioribacter roseus (strain DSM 23840 / JCM 17771 / VKM B-2668 / P3M-2) TaxID=1191523 RepID=I7A2U7_MELRP|nr:glutamine-hydrolyzing GMP synthase [Melioribacter roseus]AFN75523.1 GMP synthase glutamine-hydrolyzing [Melioribacter roseus P3M-2]
MEHPQKIIILDFGSQYTQLIARRIRESKVYSEIHPHHYDLNKIIEERPKGIILSGGPMSVYDEDAPVVDKKIFELGIPILGICYGMQLIARYNGGNVEPASNREYGKAEINIIGDDNLLKDVENNSVVWMSHGDYITELPNDYKIIARTENSPICAISNPAKKIYGLQFHPEVVHSKDGKKIIDNFLFDLCGCKPDWTPGNFIENTIDEVKKLVGDKKAICALSGGVDSSVAAVLLHKALGKNLINIHVDTGLMRKNESNDVVKMFKENFDIELVHVDASELFLERLQGVTDPEKKRKIIGNTFIEVFEKEAKKFEDAEFLVQGTLYPDVIESVSVKGKSVTIKTHHNVGGLPERMNLKLIEPFRELFKDEVREIGLKLGIPEIFIKRHPFPGPGLAVRVLGEITKERLDILREADDIFIKALHEDGIYDNIWQAFAVLLPVQSVGVMGDARTYENVLALRAVTSTDGMTADWYRFDHRFLEKVSNRIIRSVKGINRVVYDISSKPPSTIEWE